ncbi:efflux RND transporter periplasmic adaptor subunit [Xanthocytophaga flava]|uniref:efflux RND transporter periplasmic adaptor subunit n=1 Tax=Xanthocytophaga flava TaxID=3048013 RepID=UPI0028D85AE1|nr:efflux RND transporter periplasmic adaptor subunit [Xanthocytophaga flavus]MDJ1470506.1 efflux RND transporter periplasmic adaptor subunit [Xanthocytophaga flavus]
MPIKLTKTVPSINPLQNNMLFSVNNDNKIRNILLSVISGSILLSACSGEQKSQQGASNQVSAYPILKLEPQTAQLHTDFPATIKGTEDIEIRPKIDGYIEKIYIDEGATVQKSQLLFTISNPQYTQDVHNAEAAVLSAEAQVNTAQLQYDKTKPLVQREIVSPLQLETAENTLKTQKALLAQAKASLATARTNQGYTRVVSPVSGVVGTIPYKIGSYVNSSTSQPLTMVANISKVYAYFSINEKWELSFFRNTPGETFEQKLKNMPAVSLILSDGTTYPQSGRIETVSGLINTETGSANVRAGFENPTRMLRSGSSATIRIPTVLENAIMIPQKATYEIQGKRFVYVLQPDQTVKSVEIHVNSLTTADAYVVEEGLKAGDTIVSDGVATLTDGTKIQPQLSSQSSVSSDK